MPKTGTMTFGTSVTKTFKEWEERLDKLVYPRLFRQIVQELKVVGYEPKDVKQRLRQCQQRYDQIETRSKLHTKGGYRKR